MATKAVIWILPLAGLTALSLGATAGLGPWGLLAVYSILGQIALMLITAAGALPRPSDTR